jgi:mercuric reductase
MNMNTAETLYRLHGLLPLKERQQSLSPEETGLHRMILHSFIERGRPLERTEISRSEWIGDFDSILARLRVFDLIVLDDRSEVVGAYPFTMERTPHHIEVNGHRIYAMCALDALAVSPMFGLEVQINSRCAVSQDPIHLRQRDLELLEIEPSKDLLLGIHWQESTTCAAHSLCREMVFLKNLDVAMTWQEVVSEARELFEIQEAVQISAQFFVPLLREMA